MTKNTARDFIENELLPMLFGYDDWMSVRKYIINNRHKWDTQPVGKPKYKGLNITGQYPDHMGRGGYQQLSCMECGSSIESEAAFKDHTCQPAQGLVDEGAFKAAKDEHDYCLDIMEFLQAYEQAKLDKTKPTLVLSDVVLPLTICDPQNYAQIKIESVVWEGKYKPLSPLPEKRDEHAIKFNYAYEPRYDQAEFNALIDCLAALGER